MSHYEYNGLGAVPTSSFDCVQAYSQKQGISPGVFAAGLKRLEDFAEQALGRKISATELINGYGQNAKNYLESAMDYGYEDRTKIETLNIEMNTLLSQSQCWQHLLGQPAPQPTQPAGQPVAATEPTTAIRLPTLSVPPAPSPPRPEKKTNVVAIAAAAVAALALLR